MRDRSTGGRGVRLLRSSIGPVIGAACLAWVIHDVELGSTLEAVRRMRWDLVALAIGFDVVSFVAQGIRWTLLLSPVGTLSWLDATQAVYAVLMMIPIGALVIMLLRNFIGVKTFGKRLPRKIGKKREGDGGVRMHGAHTPAVRPTRRRNYTLVETKVTAGENKTGQRDTLASSFRRICRYCRGTCLARPGVSCEERSACASPTQKL